MAMSCDLGRIAVAAAAMALLGGCTAVDPGMGEALKYDMAAQTIDPDPVYADSDAKPGDNGAVGAEAVKRYRKGQVKAIETIRTGNGGSGGSGGGGLGGAAGGGPGN